MALNIISIGDSDTIGFTADSGNGAVCPPFPPPPFPPYLPFPPPPAPKPSVVDDNVPYNPATYADLQKVRLEGMAYDDYLSSKIAELSGRGGGSIVIDEVISHTSTNPVQNKVIAQALDDITIPIDSILSLTSINPVENRVVTENFVAMSGDINELSGIASLHTVQIASLSSREYPIDSILSLSSTNPVENGTITYNLFAISGDIGELSGTSLLHTEQISALSSSISDIDDKIEGLSGWCVKEFINDEFTDFVDLPFHKEIRGGYSDDDILLIGSKGDGLHYMLPGEDKPTRCSCPDGQTEFDEYQFRNIISGNGCYVATNRNSSARTNVYVSEDGITWSKKNHTIKHTDTNGNICYSEKYKKYYHVCASEEYPELSATGQYCVETTSDLETWTVLNDASDSPIVSTHDFRSVMCADDLLYITTIGGGNCSSPWYTVFNLSTNIIQKEGNDIFHDTKPTNGWLRWQDGNKVFWGLTQQGVNYSDRIIATSDGFETYEEYVINPGNRLNLEFSGIYKNLIPRSLTKFNGVYFMGTYETASPHILMSYDLNYWHVVSTPPFGIGADMLCPFQGVLYVGYSGDAADAGLMADVRYTYHTDHLVIHGILQDCESGKGGSLKEVEQISPPYNDKIVRAKVNEIIAALGGKISQIPDEFTDEDIMNKVNEIIVAYS